MKIPFRLNWLARFLAAWVVFVITAGASVTSTDSGLAVPDWPLSYGMFFPPMVGGIFYEHGHRMIAGVSLLAALALAVWVSRSEPRAWVRKLAWGALGLVLAQAVLGGLTVLLLLPPQISITHACLAQAFLCVAVALAVVTGPSWQSPAQRQPDVGPVGLRRWTLVLPVVIYVQLIVGAATRHLHAGLAIPDFPLAQGRLVPSFENAGVMIHFAHRLGALLVCGLAIAALVHVLRHERRPELLRPALALIGLLVLQITLGAYTVWSSLDPVFTTAHVANGALNLAASVVWALRAHKHLSPQQGGEPAGALGEVAAA